MFTINAFILFTHLICASNCQYSAISRVDFMFEQFHLQRTAQYYDDYSGVSNVIIRRGDHFKFAVELNHKYNNEQIDIQLTFVTKKDRMQMLLPSNNRYGWKLTHFATEKRIVANMYIPGNAPIGRWIMKIMLKNSYGTVVEEYETPHKIIILCNPWSIGKVELKLFSLSETYLLTEDAVYFRDINKLSEYIMNEKGAIFTYNYDFWSYIPWIFGQFQPEVLDAVIFVLEKSELTAEQRGDVVLIARELTYLMNDDGLYYRGVLQGKWDKPWGPIDGRQSTKPWEWIGSPAILKSYYWSNGATVGYGQCWVYAGILTTVYRALGIPARPVTNFLSAHDQGIDLTLDIYLDEEGYKKKSSDVLWNFHVWVQAWFSRRDLGRHYDGWQELDATPQGLNDKKYQVGPASTLAVANVHLRSRYESAYFYSTVNADEVTYSANNEIISIKRAKIGLAVMTKAVGSDSHENIVSMYKPPENTTAERESYRMAAQVLGLRTPSLDYPHLTSRSGKKNLLITIKAASKVKVGSTIYADILVRNPSSKRTEVKFGIKATAMYYNGREAKVVKLSKQKFVLKGLVTHKVKFSISADEYIETISESYTIRIEAVAKSEYVKGFDYATSWISLTAPILTVKAPKSVKVNETFPIKIQLSNPFNRKLTNCHIVLEGTRLERRVMKVPDIPASSIGGTTVHLRSKYPLLETIVATFYANKLRDIYGSIQLKVIGKRRYMFGLWSLKPNLIHKPGTKAKGISGLQKITSANFRCCSLVEFQNN